jgi:hypothetical protein
MLLATSDIRIDWDEALNEIGMRWTGQKMAKALNKNMEYF